MRLRMSFWMPSASRTPTRTQHSHAAVDQAAATAAAKAAAETAAKSAAADETAALDMHNRALQAMAVAYAPE